MNKSLDPPTGNFERCVRVKCTTALRVCADPAAGWRGCEFDEAGAQRTGGDGIFNARAKATGIAGLEVSYHCPSQGQTARRITSLRRDSANYFDEA